MNKKAIIFGVTGQDGHYLCRLLKAKGVTIIGVSRKSGFWTKGNIAELSFVDKLISDIKPDYIFHFAAESSTNHSSLFGHHDAIVKGSLNVLESVKNHCPETKVFLSGSALQFVMNNKPITEKTEFAAESSYSLARINSVYIGRYYRKRFNLKVYTGYFFHHDSPLRPDKHINQRIALAVRRIANGSNEKILLGDLSARKEFNFAGDIVKAVWILVNQDNVFEAVIGSGQAYSIEDYLKCCFKIINQNYKDYVEVDQKFSSPYKLIVSNPAIIKSLGWKPQTSLQKMAQIMVLNQHNA